MNWPVSEGESGGVAHPAGVRYEMFCCLRCRRSFAVLYQEALTAEQMVATLASHEQAHQDECDEGERQ